MKRLLSIITCCVCSLTITAHAQPQTQESTTRPTSRQAEPPQDPTIAAARVGNTAEDFQAAHQRLLTLTKKGNIDLLFLGDSITGDWIKYPDVWKRVYADNRAANYGVAGDRTQNVLWRIQNGELEGLNPKVVVLQVGTNNTGINSSSEIARGIENIVQSIRTKCPNTKVLLLGIFPRSRELEEARSDAIRQINPVIAKLDDGKMVRYLDLTSKFVGADGKVSKELMPDYLHPNSKGYDTWAKGMQPLLDEMLKD